MTDLKLIPGTFKDTAVKMEGVTEKGKAFLQEIVGSSFAGVHGVTLPKTRGFDLARFAEQKGLSVAVFNGSVVERDREVTTGECPVCHRLHCEVC